MNQINSIPKATNTEPVSLIVVVPAYNAIAVKQVAAPGTVSTVLRRTPPVTAAAKVVERTKDVTVTARKT